MSTSTIPTAPVSLSAIQSEFGGANPISLSEYYRETNSGGIVVPPYANITGTYGTIPTSGQISLGQFRNSSQGIALQITFSLVSVGNDPYYRGEAYVNGGSFYTAPGVYIGAGLYVLYGNSVLDEAGGQVFTTFYFNGDVSSSSATIVNHLNGRTRSFGDVSPFNKTYQPAQNWTTVTWSEGFSGGGGLVGGGGWPNDGITTNGLLGAPTTWNQSGQVPNVPFTFTYYNSYLRAF